MLKRGKRLPKGAQQGCKYTQSRRRYFNERCSRDNNCGGTQTVPEKMECVANDDEKDDMKRETEMKTDKDFSRPKWTVPNMDEPKAEKKAEGKMREKEGKSKAKAAKAVNDLAWKILKNLEMPHGTDV